MQYDSQRRCHADFDADQEAKTDDDAIYEVVQAIRHGDHASDRPPVIMMILIAVMAMVPVQYVFQDIKDSESGKDTDRKESERSRISVAFRQKMEQGIAKQRADCQADEIRDNLIAFFL